MKAQRAELCAKLKPVASLSSEGDILCALFGVDSLVLEFWGCTGLLVSILPRTQHDFGTKRR